MSWENFGEMSKDDGHTVYVSRAEDRHGFVVGFIVHKDIVSIVLGYRSVSSRLISIRLGAAPFNIAIRQVYAPTSGYVRSTTSTSNQGNHRPNTKDRHSGCTKGLEC